MDNLDKLIFDDKKFSDILKEIYSNQKKKENQITTLINQLKPMIEELGDATLIVPLIKEYLEIGVKNDELLVKLATIIQRSQQSSPSNSDNPFSISEEEKQQLLSDIDKLRKDND